MISWTAVIVFKDKVLTCCIFNTYVIELFEEETCELPNLQSVSRWYFGDFLCLNSLIDPVCSNAKIFGRLLI